MLYLPGYFYLSQLAKKLCLLRVIFELNDMYFTSHYTKQMCTAVQEDMGRHSQMSLIFSSPIVVTHSYSKDILNTVQQVISRPGRSQELLYKHRCQ